MSVAQLTAAIPPEARPDWWEPYLALDHAEGGRDGAAGVDCWGLVRLIYARELGIGLPRYDVISASDAAAIVARMDGEVWAFEGPWAPVQHGFEKPFDVARIMRPAKINGTYVRLPYHAGVVTRPGHLIHMDRPTGVIEVAFRDDGHRFLHHYSMPPRDVALYRHQALAARAAA
jgi:cell wall-associated NlpC family hydrolase